MTKAKARSKGKGKARDPNKAVAAPTEAAGDDTPKNVIFGHFGQSRDQEGGTFVHEKEENIEG